MSVRPSPPADYRAYLRRLLKDRELLQRDFAAKMGRSPAWASQILNGRRRLQQALAEEIAEVLHLDDGERLEFLGLVEMQSASLPPGREIPDAPLPGWVVGAVFELARCDQYEPDPAWVAAALRPRITVQEARRAMLQLRRQGRLDAQLRSVAARPVPPRRVGDREAHEVSALAVRALETIPGNERRHLSASIALSEEGYARFLKRIEDLVDELVATDADALPNRVYHVSVGTFPISLYSDSSAHPSEVPD